MRKLFLEVQVANLIHKLSWDDWQGLWAFLPRGETVSESEWARECGSERKYQSYAGELWSCSLFLKFYKQAPQCSKEILPATRSQPVQVWPTGGTAP